MLAKGAVVARVAAASAVEASALRSHWCSQVLELAPLQSPVIARDAAEGQWQVLAGQAGDGWSSPRPLDGWSSRGLPQGEGEG